VAPVAAQEGKSSAEAANDAKVLVLRTIQDDWISPLN
jgi:hypothetical protein